MHTWQLQEAKSRFSEVVDRRTAEKGRVTRHPPRPLANHLDDLLARNRPGRDHQVARYHRKYAEEDQRNLRELVDAERLDTPRVRDGVRRRLDEVDGAVARRARRLVDARDW